jgi:hypothetical protein
MNDFQIISSKMENKGQSHREEGFPPQLAVLMEACGREVSYRKYIINLFVILTKKRT